ncbi:MAG TPA: hypothetical protein VFA32_01880 [Dehalococcoidia bacterium]|jgi:hypothetical protein|nr:hypothetical protein [Dehalococcoidia bacterium]
MISSPGIPCIVCGTSLTLRTARGRKSGKVFLMLVCPADGRHLRAFINDETYVRQVLARLEGHTPSLEEGADVDGNPSSSKRTRTNLEGGDG